MIYDVKAPGRCCQKQHAIPSLDIPHGQKPKTPKKAQNANPQPPRPRTEHPTAHIKRKHPQHVWSLGSSVKYLIFLIFFFFIKITFVYFLFSAPDVASGICVHLSLFKVLSVSIYCSVPPHTSTNAEGQRLNRPKGSVRCSDSCQGLLCLLCMCERGL